jgi:RNA polymerase subunit RPABC4/transcription elongation factor Spt4
METVKVYYCKECPRVYTRDILCPVHETTNEEMGWYEKND